MTTPPKRSAASARPARTVFFGSGTFAVPLLETLRSHRSIEVVGVVAPPDRPSGRHGAVTAVPIAAAARAMGLPLLQPARLRTAEAAATIAAMEPDLGVLADFGRIVPPTILDLPAHGILNLHPSLLPRHRGATPIPATILAGDRSAGVSLMRMDEGLDTGPIVATRAWPVEGHETAPELEARAAVQGAELVAEVLDAYLRGERPLRPQAGVPTLTRPLHRDDGRLDPGRGAAVLERQVRAYQPWPGSYLDLPSGRLVVLRAEVVGGKPGDRGDAVGTLAADGDGVALLTTAGRLRLLEVQPAGGRPMPATAFRRGHPAVIGQAPVGVP